MRTCIGAKMIFALAVSAAVSALPVLAEDYGVEKQLFSDANIQENGFPDLACLLGTSCQELRLEYWYDEEFFCDAYIWDYPAGWEESEDKKLAEFTADRLGGWKYEAVMVEGYAGFHLTSPAEAQAYLFSKFDNKEQILALVPSGMPIVDQEEEDILKNENAETEVIEDKTEEKEALDRGEAQSGQVAGNAERTGHFEWRQVERDCPSCMGGSCRICNGTGVYRMYGQEVLCDIFCSACSGKGTITQDEYVYVP